MHAALSEAGIVVAVALSAAFLGERVTRARLAGAAVVVAAGIALIGS